MGTHLPNDTVMPSTVDAHTNSFTTRATTSPTLPRSLSYHPNRSFAASAVIQKLTPHTKCTDVTLTATHSVRFYYVILSQHALVTVNVQESRTTARCAIYASPVHCCPDTHTAVWRLVSAQPQRRLVIHPADASYRLGRLYVSVRYLDDSGSSTVRLSVSVQTTFRSAWFGRARCCRAVGLWQSALHRVDDMVVERLPKADPGHATRDEQTEPRGATLMAADGACGVTCIQDGCDGMWHASCSSSMISDSNASGDHAAESVCTGVHSALSPWKMGCGSVRERVSACAGTSPEMSTCYDCRYEESSIVRCGESAGDDDAGAERATTLASFYVGEWQGAHRHGRGLELYFVNDALASEAANTIKHSTVRTDTDPADEDDAMHTASALAHVVTASTSSSNSSSFACTMSDSNKNSTHSLRRDNCTSAREDVAHGKAAEVTTTTASKAASLGTPGHIALLHHLDHIMPGQDRSPWPLIQAIQERPHLPWSAQTLPTDFAILDGDMTYRMSRCASRSRHPNAEDCQEHVCKRQSDDDGNPPTTQTANKDDVASLCAVAAGAPSRSVKDMLERITGAPGVDGALARAQGAHILTFLSDGVEAYDGEWLNGAKSGQGIFQWRNSAYVGSWRQDMRQGHGVLQRNDGSWYAGEWDADRRHGFGEARLWPGGPIYVGPWARGKRQGWGALHYTDGTQVQGWWEGDVLQGQDALLPSCTPSCGTGGTMTAATTNGPDVTLCSGTNACKSAPTTHTIEEDHTGDTTPNRDTSDGCGRGGARVAPRANARAHSMCATHGMTHSAADATTTQSHARGKDASVGGVTTTYRDGSMYVGQWYCGQRHGVGTLIDAAGRVHRHSWRCDKPVGAGTVTLQHGRVVFHGCWDADGCVIADSGAYHFDSGDVYTGGWDEVAGVREGVGRCVFANGDVYDGMWHNDRRCGHGRVEMTVHRLTRNDDCIRACDASATGGSRDCRHDATIDTSRLAGSGADTRSTDPITNRGGDESTTHCRRGSCTMRPNGRSAGDERVSYEGEWAEDTPHGCGVWRDSQGVYEGEFQHGMRCGAGVQYDHDGSVYRGSWCNDQWTGRGVHYDAIHGIRYEGVFLCNKLAGQGRAVDETTHCVYEGGWLDGERQGCGTMRLSNGSTVRGVWHRNVAQDGWVECDNCDGRERYVGEMHHGKRDGQGTRVDSEGAVYEGSWKEDMPHGHGRWTRVTGDSVEGEWCAGVLQDGVGLRVFADGSVYRGALVGGEPHGSGELTYPDKTRFSGLFRRGVYVL